ncbi:MAG: hypothetical protein JNG83_15025 [Opitutaceae bacterium]|nr:hypothetical protein [Opitutaceae bacterium]
MSLSPVRILTNELFVADLKARLQVPCVFKTFNGLPDPEVARLAAETDAVISAVFKAEWRPAGASPIRLVHSTGAGLDGIARAALPPGVQVCNVYGHERGVAEQAFMHVLALQKGLLPQDAALRRGDWMIQERPYLSELRDRNLLVLGLGHIGRELVRWGRFLGMRVTVLTRTPGKATAAELGIHALGSLAEFPRHLPETDFLIIAIPATPETADFLGERELQLMKPTAFVVNVGRAPVINEAALYQALKARRIAGAGLDVWYKYYTSPTAKQLPATQPFWELDNVVMTPHKATYETMAYRWGKIAENIAHLARGEPLERVVYAT